MGSPLGNAYIYGRLLACLVKFHGGPTGHLPSRFATCAVAMFRTPDDTWCSVIGSQDECEFPHFLFSPINLRSPFAYLRKEENTTCFRDDSSSGG